MNRKWIVWFVWIAVPVCILLSPCPEGLNPKAWTLLAFYLATIVGLTLRPLPEPAVSLVVLAVYSLCFGGTSISLSGFSSGTTWLVFAACLVGHAFVSTGLGSRVAFLLINRFGQTPLRLGYVAAVTDMLISPATPSNTARTGGIIFPIFRSVAITLDSEPGPSARRIGSYFALLLHAISLTTATMFLTATAPNTLFFTFAKNVVGVDVTWGFHALAAFPPCFVILMLLPPLIYRIYPPSITTIDNKTLAAEGLEKLGPFSYREKMLVLLFIAALLLWGTSNWTKINNTAVALFFVGGALFFNVVEWDGLLKEKSAWNTLIWYATILSLAGGLTSFGFFKWLGAVVQARVDFTGMSPVLVIVLLVASSLPLRYVFASLGAYVGTMMPVFLLLSQAGGVPPMLASIALCATMVFGCLQTHFGNGVSPIIYGAGYVDQKAWWGYGLLLCIICTSLMFLIGFPWWALIGVW